MTVTNHDHPGGATSGCYTPRRVASGWGQMRLLHRGQFRLARPAGYVAMSRHVPHAAPFYALLALGLGRAWGVAGGLVALVGYNAVQIALYGLLGATLAEDLGGPWWVWAALVWLAIAVFGVLRVDISARLIAALLVVEIGVIVLFDVGAFTHPAGGSVSLDPLRPSRLFVGGLGGVFAFSIASFL